MTRSARIAGNGKDRKGRRLPGLEAIYGLEHIHGKGFRDYRDDHKDEAHKAVCT
jgi:hypothetical protein